MRKFWNLAPSLCFSLSEFSEKGEKKKGEENLKLFSPDEYSEICKNIYLCSIS